MPKQRPKPPLLESPSSRVCTKLQPITTANRYAEDVIYHLLDKFVAFKSQIEESRRAAALPNAVWPVRLEILASFANRDPIILGVSIIEGTLRKGTPLGVVRGGKDGAPREIISLGKV